jgi:hypothetical protein
MVGGIERRRDSLRQKCLQIANERRYAAIPSSIDIALGLLSRREYRSRSTAKPLARYLGELLGSVHVASNARRCGDRELNVTCRQVRAPRSRTKRGTVVCGLERGNQRCTLVVRVRNECA